MQDIDIKYTGEEDFFWLHIGDQRIDVDYSNLLTIRDKVNEIEKECEN